MDLYRQNILDHYKHPHHFGHLSRADISKTLFNSACGDKISMELQFDKDGKTIEAIAFSGEGCAVSQASASLLTDVVLGKTTKKALEITADDITHMLHTTLTPSRMKCALLPLEAIQKCILEWEKQGMV